MKKNTLYYNTVQKLFNKTYHRRNLVVDALELFQEMEPTYHWAHTHDFGDGLVLEGDANDRHICFVSLCAEKLKMPLDFEGKKILDIGPLSGGSSLLLAAMGAKVHAVEINQENAKTIEKFISAYALQEAIAVTCMDFRDLGTESYGQYDVVVCAGVIYLVEDPISSLRKLYKQLKIGGHIYLQSHSAQSDDSVCLYGGSSIYENGSQEGCSDWHFFIPSARALKSWLRDVGFEDIEVQTSGGSLIAKAAKTSEKSLVNKSTAMAKSISNNKKVE